jgi:hypothetical protein
LHNLHEQAQSYDQIATGLYFSNQFSFPYGGIAVQLCGFVYLWYNCAIVNHFYVMFPVTGLGGCFLDFWIFVFRFLNFFPFQSYLKGGVTQVVECLPSDCEALSSNSKYHLSPPTPKKHYMVLSLLLMQKTVEYVFFQLWHRIFNYLDSLYIIFI